jgi:dihydrolipoamide dehydrogenase
MSAVTRFDVVVIGAGPGGENVAGRCAEAGLSVGIVERELVGGECSYWGCIPSKVLVRPGDVVAAARRVPGADAAVNGQIDIGAALANRDRFTGGWNDAGALPWLEERGVQLVRGQARLAGRCTVDVETSDGRVVRLHADRAVVLATGTRAAIPPVPGLAAAQPWTNREITAAKEVPGRLLVLGGGATGAELAQAIRRLGAHEVTIIDTAPTLLVREEPFAGVEVRAALEHEGVTVRTGVGLASVARTGDGPVTATLADGSSVTVDEILVATGRRAATEGLGLDTIGLEPGKFVEVDDHLRATGVDGGWLYAVGDCNGRALLTHMAKYQARVASAVIIGDEDAAVDDPPVVPRVTFTDPQVSAVGMTEQEAREAGIDVVVSQVATGSVAGASVLGDGFPGTSQLVVDRGRDVIVGATFVGSGVQELLHSATVAIVAAVPITRLRHAVPSFPTVSEVWLPLLEGCS